MKYVKMAIDDPHKLREVEMCLERARLAAKGLLWHKIKVRLFRAGKIAKMLSWESERLPPKYATWDIAPMMNVTCNGDNIPWEWNETQGRGLPSRAYWLNPDPESEEYQDAMAANYWKKGHHPRSPEARKAWYRRNGGEYLAWRRGATLRNPGVDVRTGRKGRRKVTVVHTDGAYLVHTGLRLFGKLWLIWRKGYEVDNVAWRSHDHSAWVALEGPLIAPVTWGFRFRWEE